MPFGFIALMLVLLGVPVAMQAEDTPRVGLQMENVFFPSGSTMVHAFVYKPQGKGKFPAIIYNQATRDPYFIGDSLYPFETLAKWATSHNYVLFIPDRPGHDNLGKSLGEFVVLLDNPGTISPTNKSFLEGFDLVGKDISAGTRWLSQQPFVEKEKIVMLGHSTGAMQTLLMATKELPVRGYVAFSPGAKIWKDNQMIRSLLGKAVERAKGPLFLIQAKNDFSLGPSEELGPTITGRAAPNGAKVYPAFGKSATEAVMFAVHGATVWGDDVVRFFEECWK